MKRKLLVLTAVLGMSVFSSWAPQAESSAGCSDTYCAGRPAETPCACPKWTDRPGRPSFCGSYRSSIACWYV
jgi:hypothetical protein